MAPSPLYTQLEKTATSFVLATCPKEAGTNQLDEDAIQAYLTPDFEASWGHAFFVATKPGLQGRKSAHEFLEHLRAMSPHLGTWRIEVRATVVDTQKREVVVRVDFHMAAKGYKVEDGKDGAVLNDILFWIGLDEEGTKVKSMMEFVDPIASQELAGRMGADEMKKE